MKVFKTLFVALFVVAAAVSFVGCSKPADKAAPAPASDAAAPSTEAPAPASK